MTALKKRCGIAGGEPLRNRHGLPYVIVESRTLPARYCSDVGYVSHGYAVVYGDWMFFDALEPAIAFGRAARMSLDCTSYKVVRAAYERRHCRDHGEEIILHVTGPNLDRKADEVAVLKRFVQSVKEHSWSSHWHEPTGFLVDYNHGEPVKTRTPSLPL